jgi:hypothetical protein
MAQWTDTPIVPSAESPKFRQLFWGIFGDHGDFFPKPVAENSPLAPEPTKSRGKCHVVV